jgi:hypothetical protein
MVQLSDLNKMLTTSDNDTAIDLMFKESDEIFESISDSTDALYTQFGFVKLFCVLNMSFLFKDIITGIVTKRLGRFFEFPTFTHIIDLILCIVSMTVYEWIHTEID